MAKYKKIVDTTDNNRVYNIAIKLHRESTGQISCSICPYNRGENYDRFSYRWKKFKNWKRLRKTQYKVILYDVCGE